MQFEIFINTKKGTPQYIKLPAEEEIAELKQDIDALVSEVSMLKQE